MLRVANRLASLPSLSRSFSTLNSASSAPATRTSLARTVWRATYRTLAVGSVAAGGAYYALRNKDDRRADAAKIYRYVSFWSTLFPIYMDDKWTGFRLRGVDPSVREARMSAMHERYAKETLDLILHLKALYIKIGQVLATRQDILPKQYRDVYGCLFDSVPSARSGEEIRKIVCESLDIARIEDRFASFDDVAIGAASIGQVHAATLLDGTSVVVKVQYPDSEALFDMDLTTLGQFAALAQPEQLPILDELQRQIRLELDFQREAWALDTVYKNIMPHFGDEVVIPRPISGMSSRYVIVMERLEGGIKLVDGIISQYTAIAEANGITLEELRDRAVKDVSSMRRGRFAAFQLRMYVWFLWMRNSVANTFIGVYNHSLRPLVGAPRHPYYAPLTKPINHVKLMDTLMRVHGHELFIDGVFNGDPHPGNILLLPDGRIGLIDYGQVKVMALQDRVHLAKIIVALYEGTPENVVEEARALGLRTKRMDPYVIEKLARVYFDRDGPDVTEGLNLQQFGEMLDKRDPVVSAVGEYFLAARTGIILRGIAAMLAYDISTAKAWVPYAKELLRTQNERK
eukprot:TRINITY_DN7932_c0_g1_i1.p1 TRINITY_DN7932_c0_g1~~TRINITY_DN7932_c0_g1_i1.p1  ORF type:complete len:573 (+),score=140.36 TRINITY_DN7932_c0_g1_i1:36-1754(+)